MDVEVCRADADSITRVRLQLPDGALVADALALSGLAEAAPRRAVGPDTPAEPAIAYAVFGRRATTGTVLHDGDRVELLRPLQADPKEARRRRVEKKRRAG